MNLTKMLDELRQEQNLITTAILTLERLASYRDKRRGWPPAWMADLKKRARRPGGKNKANIELHTMQ
jgi:hypothetical protein